MEAGKSTGAYVLALAVMGCACGASAEMFVWNGGSDGRWNDPLSYADGTLNLANYTRAALTEIPLAIEGGGEAGATGWTVAIDGVATRRRVKFSATAATVFGLGTILSFK